MSKIIDTLNATTHTTTSETVGTLTVNGVATIGTTAFPASTGATNQFLSLSSANNLAWTFGPFVFLLPTATTSYTTLTGWNRIEMDMWGGGSAGAAGIGSNGGGGGSSGAAIIKIPLGPGLLLTTSIGAGGLGNSGNGAAGVATTVNIHDAVWTNTLTADFGKIASGQTPGAGGTAATTTFGGIALPGVQGGDSSGANALPGQPFGMRYGGGSAGAAGAGEGGSGGGAGYNGPGGNGQTGAGSAAGANSGSGGGAGGAGTNGGSGGSGGIMIKYYM